MNFRNTSKEHPRKPDNLRNTPKQPPANPLIGLIDLVLLIEYGNLDQVCDAQDKDKCANINAHNMPR
jgi:hypothetical protein